MKTTLLKDNEIQTLKNTNRELIEALKPFAEFGPDVEKYKDSQAFMGAAQLRAGHFRKAYILLVKLGILNKVAQSPELDK